MANGTQPIESIYYAVQEERIRQKAMWGLHDHDAQWTPLDWHEMISDYNGWARRTWAMGRCDEARERLIQVAALALAAIEAMDRKESQS